MLERADVVLVVVHRLFVAPSLALDLSPEPGRLVVRVVELTEPVAELPADWLAVLITMCALLPRILRLRSELNPPMTLMAPESEKEPSATAKIDSPLMSVRNPLFFART